jgi:hypothetical protein
MKREHSSITKTSFDFFTITVPRSSRSSIRPAATTPGHGDPRMRHTRRKAANRDPARVHISSQSVPLPPLSSALKRAEVPALTRSQGE